SVLFTGARRWWGPGGPPAVSVLVSRVSLRWADRHDRAGRDALRTATPIDDLGFVDLVIGVGGRRQAGGVAHGTVGVDHAAAGSADEMVMVVPHAALVARRRFGGLDAPDDPLVGEGREGVVDGLQRDRADLGPRGRVDVGGGAVRLLGHGPQNGQALGRYLHPVAAQEGGLVEGFPHRSGA